MVARILEPGCQLDYTLVLEGPQGIRKSTGCRILGGEWFSDSLPDLRQWWGPQEHLKGKWLIEIAELAAVRGATAEQLKAFLTRTREVYLPRQGNAEWIEPRQCASIATTNRSDYLKTQPALAASGQSAAARSTQAPWSPTATSTLPNPRIFTSTANDGGRHPHSSAA